MKPSPVEPDTTELPFDQYQRYRLVADILGAVRGEGERLGVLDVGGRTALLRRFLPEDRVELVDVEPSDEPGLVLGDGSRLPFGDGVFDAVVTFDTLEHVPPGRRDDFVRECRRVARRWVVIAGPYRTPEVERAERLLRGFLSDKLAQRHRYLEEHHTHGLPDRGRVEGLLGELGGRVVSIGHGNLERWLPLMGLALYLDRDAPLRGPARDFFRFYNTALHASDHQGPVYRHAVVAAFGDAPLPDPGRVVQGGPPPAGAAAPIEHLARQVLAFDAQRDVVQAEWRRLEAEHAKLREDLAGHRGTIETLGADVERLKAGRRTLQKELSRERREGKAARESLEQDLRDHRATLATLRAESEALAAELEHLRAELAREQDEGARARGALERDLDSHRLALADLGAELERERREAAQVRAALEAELAAQREGAAALGLALELEREALERDLEAHRETLAALRAEREREREGAEGVRAALSADLEGHRAALADLRAEQQRQLEHFGAERRAFERDAAALRAELDAHRALQAELGAQLEAHRAHQVELTAELQRMHGVAASIQRDLVSTQGELAQERELVARLRAELRDRWRSFKRAFAWKKLVP